MRRKQGQSHAKTHKQKTASESSSKRMAVHARAARASKLASNPGCFFTLPHFSLGRVQCTGNFRGNSKESKIERVKVKEDTEDKKVVPAS